MKKVLKIIGILLLVVLSIGVSSYCEIKSIPTIPTIGDLIAGSLLPALVKSFQDLSDNTNWKTTQRKLNRASIIQKDTIIRISFAYLFRIKVNGKYFLVQNSRTKKYQPVGGAYKYYREEAEYFRDNIPVENDNRISVDEVTKRDYRLLVKNKDLRKFVRRFNKTKHRENISDLTREFVEEIFDTEILEKTSFGILRYKYCGRHMTDVFHDDIFKYYSLHFADVVEVDLSDEQEQLFRSIMDEDDDKYCFVSASDIKTLGVKYESNDMKDYIANHTFKIISENTDSLYMRNKYKEIVSKQL